MLRNVQKFALFFIGSGKPDPSPPPRPPQCPNPNFRVAPNFGGPDSPGSNFDGDPCEDNASPPRKNWKADEEFYRYDASKDKKKKKKP